jgi:CheY-like chemotaxis protein
MHPQPSPHLPIDVLIAEDDPDVREHLRRFLEGAGYACAEAENGAEAVAVARQSPPRFLLLDLMMPELDGVATARTIRADPRTHHVSICCLTALDDATARRRALRAGCQSYLTKPVDADALLDVVSVAMAEPPAASRR